MHAYASLDFRPAMRRTAASVSLPMAVAVLGAMLLAAGAALPWITLYAGNIELRGVDGLPGWVLSGVALAALALATLPFLSARVSGTVWRLALGAVGLAAVSLSGYLLVQLVLTFRQLAADPLLLAAMGPGLFISAAGAMLVLLAAGLPLAVARPKISRLSGDLVLRVAAVGGLLLAGALHLALAPEHFGLVPLLGLGFLAAGLAQAVMAMALMTSTRRRIALGAVWVAALPLALYVLDMTVGLPLIGHEAAHAAIGAHEHASGEAHAGQGLNAAALATKSAELVALFATLVLYQRAAAGREESAGLD